MAELAEAGNARIGRGNSMFFQLVRQFIFYLLWVWVPTALSFFVHHWFFPHGREHFTAYPLLSIATSGILMAGFAVCLGIRGMGSAGLSRGKRFQRAAGAVSGILYAQLISGLLFCMAAAEFAGLYGMNGLKKGPRTCDAILTVGLGILFLSLLAGVASCTLGYAAGMLVGATPRGHRAPLTEAVSPGRWLGATAATFYIGGFAGLNTVAILGCWNRHLGSALMLRIGWLQLPIPRELVLILIAGDIWACITALWLLWLRASAGMPHWRKWLPLAPLILLTMFGVWFLL